MSKRELIVICCLVMVWLYLVPATTYASGNVTGSFSVVDAPLVTDISPSSGDNSQTRTLTITGTSFVAGGTHVVRFVSDDNTFDLINVTCDSSIQLMADVPKGAPTGTYKVRVINDNGTSELSSVTYEVTPAPGGDNPPPAPPAPSLGTTDISGVISPAGVLLSSVTITSEDGLCWLTIPEGTVALTKDLEPLTVIITLIMGELPPPPVGATIIGQAYDLGPDGATFAPPVALTIRYDPDALPEGVAEEDLKITYYDEEADEWVELPSTIDPVTHIVTASVSHFTTFTIIGTVTPPSPPLPSPAVFSVSNLSIKPVQVQPNETVTITVLVTNTGGSEGSYSVVLKINEAKYAEKIIAIAAGSSSSVSFSVVKEYVGSYSVSVNELSGSFITVPPPPKSPTPLLKPPAKHINWPVLGGIIVGVVVLGLLIFFLVRRKKLLSILPRV